jgi:hypothetical protein
MAGNAQVGSKPHLRCPRNGQTDGPVFRNTCPAFINQPLDALNKLWEGDEGCSVSPDTGQQSGCTCVFLMRCNRYCPSTVGDDGEGLFVD